MKKSGKNIELIIIEVTKYPTRLSIIVLVVKNDVKIRICMDHRYINKESLEDNPPLWNIHILIDNCAKHEFKYFMNYFARYHHILIDEEDAEKTMLITCLGVKHYQVMSFHLKNVGSNYMRAMTTIFYDRTHKK